MSDPVPAVIEADATGETAAIFADIREVLGVDVVNLIWRHFAVIPGALPLAWGMLRPLYADGTLAAAATALHADLHLPRLPPFPSEALAAVNLRASELASIRDVLAAYDHTNAMALIALSALSLRLRDRADAVRAIAPANTNTPHTQAARIPLPPLPGMAELPAEVAGLVTLLNRMGTRRERPILASMYRHLAYWPGYLALVWTLIAPLDTAGTLDRLIATAVERAQAGAKLLVARLQAPDMEQIEPTLGEAIAAAVEPFAGDVIAKMVVICALLRSATGEVSVQSV